EGFLLADEQGIIIEWNQALAQITNLTRAQALGLTVWDIQYQLALPERRASVKVEQLKNAVIGMLQNERSLYFEKLMETEIQTALGERKTIQQLSFPIRTAQGYRMGTVVRDITERKQMEIALEAETIRRRILLEESPDGILIIDPQTAGFLEFNTMAHTQLGYTREEFAQLHIFDLDVQETAEETRRHIQQVVEKGKSDFETLQRTKQGEIRNVHVTAQIVDILGQKVYYCTWRDITERKRTEEARRETDERYHLLFKSMVQGVVFQNGEGQIVQANPAAERILGLSIEQMQGRTSADPQWHAIHEDGSPFPGEDHPAMVALRTGQRVHNVVMGVFNPSSGVYHWLNINAMPRFLNGGEKPYQVYTTFEDITERKKVEDQLRESEAKYRDLINGMNDSVWVIDHDMSILDVNHAATVILGYTREEFLRMKVPDVDEALKPEHIQMLIDTLTVDKVQVFETRHKTREGKLIPVEISSSLISYQGRTVIMSIARDITERKRAEDALRISEARFVTVFRSSPNAIGIARLTDNALIDVNSAWEQVTGWSREEALGKTPVELGLWVDPAERERLKALVTEHHAAHSFEMQMRTRSGSLLNLLMSAEIIDLQGVPCLLSMTQDITERKRVENALVASEKQLKSLIDSQTHFVIRVNMEGTYSYWNAKFEREFGWIYEPTGMKNAPVLKAVCAYHHQRVKEVVEQCLAHPGQVFSVEIDKPMREGGTRTTLWEFICLTDEYNQPVEVQCMGLEITDRKRAEKALRENEERFRALIEYAPDGVVLITAEGKFTYASPSVERIFGYTQEDLPFCNSVAMTHPDDL
ncbi:MAG TPA: PAS domain S-box protein, partial [Anaerolineales bacterium]|nr:PAS domain S-box protein [Anaerolineales bacterium]